MYWHQFTLRLEELNLGLAVSLVGLVVDVKLIDSELLRFPQTLQMEVYEDGRQGQEEAKEGKTFPVHSCHLVVTLSSYLVKYALVVYF